MPQVPNRRLFKLKKLCINFCKDKKRFFYFLISHKKIITLHKNKLNQLTIIFSTERFIPNGMVKC